MRAHGARAPADRGCRILPFQRGSSRSSQSLRRLGGRHRRRVVDEHRRACGRRRSRGPAGRGWPAGSASAQDGPVRRQQPFARRRATKIVRGPPNQTSACGLAALGAHAVVDLLRAHVEPAHVDVAGAALVSSSPSATAGRGRAASRGRAACGRRSSRATRRGEKSKSAVVGGDGRAWRSRVRPRRPAPRSHGAERKASRLANSR